MEERRASIHINKAGGTASEGSKNYKISLPSSWIKALGIDEENKEVALLFDGEAITIRKNAKTNYDSFRINAVKKGHSFAVLYFYNKNKLCTKICADYTSKMLAVENMTEDVLLTAFGVEKSPSWAQYEAFLCDRCIPKERDGIKLYLRQLGIDKYDPLDIIRKTKGKMAEDDFWINIEEERYDN